MVKTETPKRPPDFVIPGAPRTGTTFMHAYLDQHPGIFMSPVKEPNHFATDLDSGSYMDSVTFMRDADKYFGLFAGATSGQLTGEASTWYLLSKDAALNIKANNPDTKIIPMLREPVAMLHSLHLRRIYGGSENITSFEEALAAEPDRRAGKRIPAKARNVKALFYRDVGRYSEQVERFLDAFGADRVHVVIFEEFRQDPAAAYRGVVEFLGADPAFEPTFEVVNAGLARRSQRVQQLLLSPIVVKTARTVIPVNMRPAVGRTWDRINSRSEKPARLDPAVAFRLRAELQPDVERLEKLIGRDLSSLWPMPSAE